MNSKVILINAIILRLNEELTKMNKLLVQENLHSEQKPHHGIDTFISLIYKTDAEINTIAKAAGI